LNILRRLWKHVYLKKTKQNKTKQNKTKQQQQQQKATATTKTKQSKAKQNKTKQNKTKQNKAKQNKTKQNKKKCRWYTSYNKTGVSLQFPYHRDTWSNLAPFLGPCLGGVGVGETVLPEYPGLAVYRLP